MKKILHTLGLLYLFLLCLNAQVYMDVNAPIEERVEDALNRMTTEEKVDIVHGWSKFMVKGVPRLGIPELITSDGPHGVRAETSWNSSTQLGWLNDSCTAFPSEIALAATWNTDLAYQYGKALGEEMRYRKKDIALCPGINIYRTPLCARNMEYMGEDPYLAGHLAAQYIIGVQENGVAACVKHFALNNQETNRHTVDVRLSDRSLYEIYLSAFDYVIHTAHPLSIMASYNMWNGQHCCHNKRLLQDILRNEWQYDGLVISDWNGTHNTHEAIFNGLDLEMGTKDGNYYMAEPYLKMIREGEVGLKELDEKVRHILTVNFLTAMNPNRPWGSINTQEHHEVAYKVASEGIVLLKNSNNLLPLQKDANILVVGENAIRQMTLGGGSSTLKAQYEIIPLEGIKSVFSNVLFARGYVGDTVNSYDGYKARINLNETRSAIELRDEAIKLAKKADVVIFIGGLNKIAGQEREGYDRKSYGLSYGQDELIEALVEANKQTVVVLIGGNAMALPWQDKIQSLIYTGYLGSEAGNAIAGVLSGDINPSGKLPFTWMKQLEDYNAHRLHAYDTTQNIIQEYTDDIYVGYRYSDLKKSPSPLFAFGYGLSYSTFSIHDAQCEKLGDEEWKVSCSVTNVGKQWGKETIQLYISDIKSSVPRPVKELKGFTKVALSPDETKEVSFVITKQDLSYYDELTHSWVAEQGDFQILIGNASNNIHTSVKMNYKNK